MAQLTPDQLERLSQISNPILRQRFAVFYQLPSDLQESMFSEQTSGEVWNIAKVKYNLSGKNISAVARIIGLIFLGEMPIKNFIIALQRDLNVDMKTAQAIAQDINLAIFQPVRESLMMVHNIAENSKSQNTNYKQIPNNNIQNPNQVTRYEKGQTLKPEFPRSDLENSNSQKFPPYQEVNPNVSPFGRSAISRQNPKQATPLRSGQDRSYAGQARQARPAVLRMIPNKNVIDLRLVAQGKKKHNKKDRYDGFFTA